MITADELDYDTAVSLWQALLREMICGLASADRSIRRESEDWVGPRPSRDFAIVAEFAGFDPRWLHDGMSLMTALPREDRRAWLTGTIGSRQTYRRGKPRIARAGERACAICSTRISPDNKTGLCRQHTHAVGVCECIQCRRVA